MYFSDIGVIALILALGFSVLAMIIAVIGAVHRIPASAQALVMSAKRSVLAVTFFLLLASYALVESFLTHDFGLRYVSDHSSLSMPWYYTISAFTEDKRDRYSTGVSCWQSSQRSLLLRLVAYRPFSFHM